MADPRGKHVLRAGFLLSQLGAHSSARFAEVLAPFDLTPPHVGLLWSIATEPGQRQQSLAERFGLAPSRMVGLLDDLERLGLVERRRDPQDRRAHLLHLTDTGTERVAELGRLAGEAEKRLLHALSAAERRQLVELLGRVAEEQGLQPGVHPGYRGLRG